MSSAYRWPSVSCCADHSANGCVPAPYRSTPEFFGHLPDLFKGLAEIIHGFADVLADTGHQFDRVPQQFLVNAIGAGETALSHQLEEPGSRIGEVTRLSIN